VSKEEERALWGAAVVLLERNRSFFPKDASPASVGVMKMLPKGEIIPKERQQEKEAA
jgi:hypothetical protein